MATPVGVALNVGVTLRCHSCSQDIFANFNDALTFGVAPHRVDAWLA